VLVAIRLLQGVAGGIGVVIARAVVRDLYAGVAAAKFFSRLTLIFGLAPIAAPSLGSAVLTVASWHGIFVALGIIAALLTLVIAVGLRDTARATGVLCTDRIFLGYALAQSFAFAALFSYISGSSFALQDGYGVSPTVFSLLFGANAVGLIVVSQANGKLLDRFAPRRLLLISLAAQALAGGTVLVAALAGSLPLLITGLFAMVATIGMGTPNSAALALDRHPDRAGTAAALLGGIQSVIAAAAAPLTGLGDPGRGVPMAIAILACAATALLAMLLTLTRSRA
jgi:DHA1 family bicyclomycin/chloramphenicol resistance-like MFS transporter